jgi:sugar porter (SP) family MFS transporter
MPQRLFLWSLTSALAGFLFGFDTVVISGAEQTIQALWQLSPGLHGIAMGSALYGTVLGALVGGWPTDRWGRRRTLQLVGWLFVISGLASGLAWDVYALSVARFVGGVGIGIATVAAPLFIAEIAPAARRGRLAGLFQFNIVFGIIVAYLSNYLLRDAGEQAWRWMLGIEALPAVVYTALCYALPESPRWLLTRRGDRAGALVVLRQIEPTASAPQLERWTDEMAVTQAPADAGRFWTRQLRRPILLAVLVAFFNQLSGINAVLYFAPRIFELTGLGQQAALLQSVGVGVTNLVFTFVGLWLIDRLGRRTLLYIGSFGYIASLGLTSWAFFTGHHAIVPVCLFGFIAAHAIGQGAVIWVFIAEVFPNRHRAAGQALGSSTHWVFAAALTTVFPTMVTLLPPGAVFLFFAGMMVLQLLWVHFVMPETKQVSLEQIERELGTRAG